MKIFAYVNRKWIGAKNGKKFAVRNAVEDSVIDCIPDLDASDAKLDIDYAADAFKTHSTTLAKERRDSLRYLYNLMVQNSQSCCY